MLFISQHHEIILVVSAEITGTIPGRVRVTVCPDHHSLREHHRYLAAAAIDYVGVEKIHPAFVGLYLHDHPESEFFVILFVIIGHYRPKACSYCS